MRILNAQGVQDLFISFFYLRMDTDIPLESLHCLWSNGLEKI